MDTVTDTGMATDMDMDMDTVMDTDTGMVMVTVMDMAIMDKSVSETHTGCKSCSHWEGSPGYLGHAL